MPEVKHCLPCSCSKTQEDLSLILEGLDHLQKSSTIRMVPLDQISSLVTEKLADLEVSCGFSVDKEKVKDLLHTESYGELKELVSKKLEICVDKEVIER